MCLTIGKLYFEDEVRYCEVFLRYIPPVCGFVEQEKPTNENIQVKMWIKETELI